MIKLNEMNLNDIATVEVESIVNAKKNKYLNELGNLDYTVTIPGRITLNVKLKYNGKNELLQNMNKLEEKLKKGTLAIEDKYYVVQPINELTSVTNFNDFKLYFNWDGYAYVDGKLIDLRD